jgi:DNA-binding CsgD family transcriptional regulator
MEKDITLTPREKTVIDAIKKGFITSEEIAEELHISKNYTDKVLCDLFVKLDVTGKQPRARLVWEVMR